LLSATARRWPNLHGLGGLDEAAVDLVIVRDKRDIRHLDKWHTARIAFFADTDTPQLRSSGL
jgi:hypothetical protein